VLLRKVVRSRPEILDEFVGLHRRTGAEGDAAILRFARRYGVLWLCREHALPTTHSASCRGALGRPPWRERLAAWRTYSRLFANAALLSESLQARDDGDDRGELWAALELRPREDREWDDEPRRVEPVFFDSYTDAVGRILPIARRDRERIRRNQREMLAKIVDEWLRVGGVRTFFSWDPTPLLRSSESSLFGALALTLALRISQRATLFTCDNCGGPLPSSKYHPPRLNERHWCRKPKCRRAMRADASREHRRRRAEAGAS
jgi:hypothetical protein